LRVHLNMLYRRLITSSFKACLGQAGQRQSSTLAESFYNEEQKALQATTKKLIQTEINPFVDQWEKERWFPARKVFKKFGDAGLLGINKPTEYGGLGLDYKYELAFLEAAGHIRSGGVAMALGVQTDCSTPALARFGSDELKRNYLEPALKGS
jgi:citronellyl-CoA dehydrogenase